MGLFFCRSHISPVCVSVDQLLTALLSAFYSSLDRPHKCWTKRHPVLLWSQIQSEDTCFSKDNFSRSLEQVSGSQLGISSLHCTLPIGCHYIWCPLPTVAV